VLAADTTQATASNRLKLYINGTQVTAFNATIYPTQNFNTAVNNNVAQYIGYYNNLGTTIFYYDGYLTEINFIDGQALTPSSFGETNPATGVWQPKKYTGTYGTNGFYLNFSDPSAATAAAIGKDYSGNGNNWTPNNITLSPTTSTSYDSMLDVPTPWGSGVDARGNYCTLNPLKNNGSISNANLVLSTAGASGYYTSYSTQSMDSGKYYWEMTIVDDGVNSRYSGFGIADPSIGLTSIGTSLVNTPAGNSRGWMQTIRSAVNVFTVGLFNNNTSVNTTTRATTSGTRVLMVAYDADSGKCWMGYEGAWWTGDPAAGTSQYFTATAPMTPIFTSYNDGSVSGFADQVNFGQRPFAYTLPTGFNTLNTLNLPTPTIANGAQFMAATLYTGNGSAQSINNTVNGVSFQPDFVWVKARSIANSNTLVNSAVGATSFLSSNSTNAEATNAQVVSAITSTGFSVGNDGNTNSNTNTYVGWQWKEGATQGFDIVLYTGNSTVSRSISHSLGVTPSMIIVKNRSAVQNWPVAHASLAVGNLLTLDTTQATVAAGTRLRLGDSSAFTVGDAADYGITNQTGQNYVAYCFASVAGFSRFGSYTGNGSADGPFVFCGFRPRWIMMKRTDTTGSWYVVDTARDSFNVMSKDLFPNLASAENVFATLDAVANGFKLRNTGVDMNASGGTYIFAAFAENPLKYALAR
jgi:hypothetical protein